MHTIHHPVASVFVALAFVCMANAPVAKADQTITNYTTYFTVQSSHFVSLGEDRQAIISEYTGITRNDEESDVFNDMAVKCLGQFYTDGLNREGSGYCRETDLEGDEMYTKFTFSTKREPPGGTHIILGGTGKYTGIEGTADYAVKYLYARPGINSMFVIKHKATWKIR